MTATLPKVKTEEKPGDKAPASAVSAPKAPDFAGRTPEEGDIVLFGLKGTDGVVRKMAAMLVERSPVTGLWALQVFRAGSSFPVRDGRFSPSLADGCWTWKSAGPPATS